MMRKSLRIFLFFTFSFLFAGIALAQHISGTVVDVKTRKPLSGANIRQLNTRNGTSSDDKGKFSLTLMPDHPSKIKITFVGYKSRVVDIKAQSAVLNIGLIPREIMSNEVFVEASRVDKRTPIAFENISRKEIAKKNLGQDIPYLLNSTPSVTASSDAGAGIGYTHLRIRGVDQRRINVTINGIPVNDPESHGVFWVDMPDLASSVQNIQVQRGVGSSTNGAGAFGATVNIQTSKMKAKPNGEVNLGLGSFNTRKANVVLGTGLLKHGWQFEGRLSKLNSDGYIDRASSDLKSFYLSAAKHGDRSLLRADVFSGKEQTYQAWSGVPESKLEQGDRTYNPLGMEKPGKPYENQTDNYQQTHYQLHYSYQLTQNWSANAAVFYRYGKGYYEEYKADQSLDKYNIDPAQVGDTTISNSDLIRDLWLSKKFYGTVFSTKFDGQDRWSMTLGGGFNRYLGNHYGELKWSRFAGQSEINQQYYNNDASKEDMNLYVKGQYNITLKLNAFADAQVRHISYDFLGKDQQRASGGGEEIVDVRQNAKLTFFNPKGGLTYHFTPNQRIYASLSLGNKEPTRDEYVNSAPQNRPQSETLYDWELGYEGSFRRFHAGANLYFMNYDEQLILTGEVNNVGAKIRQNVPDSYRAGIELQASLQLLRSLSWSANATLSRNKIKEYTYYFDNYDTGDQVPEEYNETDIAFSPDVIAYSGLHFLVDPFSVNFSAKYVSRQYLDNTETKSRSLDPYLINSLRFGYTWKDAPALKSIKAKLQVNNLFDVKYESDGYTFGGITKGKREFSNYYFPQAGRNVLFQLSFEF